MSFVCSTLDAAGQCVQWVEQASLVSELAITREQASVLSAAVCSSLILGWIIGEAGALMKSMLRR